MHDCTSKYFLQLILELGPYIEELSKTGGAIKEFVNPKYFSCPYFWSYDIVCISFGGKVLLVSSSIVSKITHGKFYFILFTFFSKGNISLIYEIRGSPNY